VLLYIIAMDIQLRIRMNEKIYLRNPEESALGKNIVRNGLLLINQIGFEEFTFKKLAKQINTTEASIYRYFENKHRLLLYIINWYWSYLEYKVVFNLHNMTEPEMKLKRLIELLTIPEKDENNDFISEYEAFKLVMWEASKTYLTRNVTTDNQDKLFKPYKDLCSRFSDIIKEYSPDYKFPHTLASTVLEMSHMQKFFMHNLPSLTDFGNDKNDNRLLEFLQHLLFDSLNVTNTTKQKRKAK
jgi:AcrR family transcriptional regulator